MEAALKINEIFYSIQGESSLSGKPTTFIRTATCNMRCTYCDTRYSFWEGYRMTLSEIIEEVKKNHTKYVCLTGGEPLGQKASIPLMKKLIELGYTVSLETGGGFSVKDVPKEVIKVIDIKCPGSGETKSMDWSNLGLADKKDQFKFVVSSKEDFDWAMALAEKENLAKRADLLVSSVTDKVSESDVAQWVLGSRVPLTFQTQIHKKIWASETRGV